MTRHVTGAVNLSVTNVSIIAASVSGPLHRISKIVIRIGTTPKLQVRVYPDRNVTHGITRPVLRVLFPPTTPTEIPVITVANAGNGAAAAHLATRVFGRAKRIVNCAAASNVCVNGGLMRSNSAAKPRDTRIVLRSPAMRITILRATQNNVLHSKLTFGSYSVDMILGMTTSRLKVNSVRAMRSLTRLGDIITRSAQPDNCTILGTSSPLITSVTRQIGKRITCFSVSPRGRLIHGRARRKNLTTVCRRNCLSVLGNS